MAGKTIALGIVLPEDFAPKIVQINPHHALARVLREVAAGYILRSLYEVTEVKRQESYGDW